MTNAQTALDTPPSGTDALVSTGEKRSGRLPLLREILEDWAQAISLRFEEEVGAAVAFGLEGTRTVESKAVDLTQGAFAFVRILPWGKVFVLLADRCALELVLEVSLGGAGKDPFTPLERPFSEIDRAMAERFFKKAFEKMAISWGGVGEVSFSAVVQFGCFPEEMPDIKWDGEWFLGDFSLNFLENCGKITLAIPQAFLSQITHLLGMKAPVPDPVVDHTWAAQLSKGLGKADVSLDIFLGESTLSLGEVASLKVGDIVSLDSNPSRRILIQAADQPLFWGELGQSHGQYVVRVKAPYNSEQEFIDGILKG